MISPGTDPDVMLDRARKTLSPQVISWLNPFWDRKAEEDIVQVILER